MVPETPHTGIQTWHGQHNITVLRLHYEADPDKAQGQKVHVPELGMWLTPWAKKEYDGMTNPALFMQEYEINAEATLGQLLYHMDAEATLCKSFPIPQHWTRYMGLDPHPGIPHAFLWCAVDPWGDRWYYRELWPSKVCFRYDGDMLLGKPGPCPEDDNRVTIAEYVEVLKYLESSENRRNVSEDGTLFEEKISKRVIDYTARAFGKGTNDDPEVENFQQRYEKYLGLPPVASCPFFSDAKKDHDAGQERVAQGLKPIEVMGNDGRFKKSSAIHIFADQCPELVWQIKNNRRQQLSPQQAESHDPSGKPIKVRNHQTDLLRYVEMGNPIYYRESHLTDAQPVYAGTSY